MVYVAPNPDKGNHPLGEPGSKCTFNDAVRISRPRDIGPMLFRGTSDISSVQLEDPAAASAGRFGEMQITLAENGRGAPIFEGDVKISRPSDVGPMRFRSSSDIE